MPQCFYSRNLDLLKVSWLTLSSHQVWGSCEIYLSQDVKKSKGMDYPLKVMRREAERSYQRSVNARFYCMALRVASRCLRIRVGSGCVHFLNSADSVALRSWYWFFFFPLAMWWCFKSHTPDPTGASQTRQAFCVSCLSDILLLLFASLKKQQQENKTHNLLPKKKWQTYLDVQNSQNVTCCFLYL